METRMRLYRSHLYQVQTSIGIQVSLQTYVRVILYMRVTTFGNQNLESMVQTNY